ncbi:MAG: leucine-rich repeat protein, partial [Clostridia bacterium]|nr:leucine-rich repeat protein [Clostridia bacterium]MDY6184220.1 leucine-rich repeat protein [Eubacteriales bacterium]
ECAFCGTKQTVPRLTDEKRANLYDRANHFRRIGDYDKAMALYEQILAEDATDAEAYWSIVLCRYGIEYVEDPTTHKRVPTVHRAQYTSILADEDYLSALSHADGYQRDVLESEAKEIDRLQKEILAISKKEKPFDVFICYKETGDDGARTKDSVLAQDLYFALTNEGMKVFFARITLENKLGSAYEPYIFAALHSAKVMVALGTKPEYFKAVWVKNEWSRYLSLMREGAQKTLIPAYRDMDPYDLPDDFSHLQALDMSRIGFLQDLVRGIRKILDSDRPAAPKTAESTAAATVAPASTASASISSLFDRVHLFLEDEDWDSANEYCERILDIDPRCADAYFLKLLVTRKCLTADALVEAGVPIVDDPNYRKALRFATEETKTEWLNYSALIAKRIQAQEDARKESIYTRVLKNTKSAYIDDVTLRQAISELNTIKGYKDVDHVIAELEKRLAQWYEDKRTAAIYAQELREKQKRKNRRIVIAICATVVIVLAVLIAIVVYQQAPVEIDGLRLVRKENGYKVTGTTETLDTYVIPSECHGKPVIAIGMGAFENKTNVTSVTIPSSVTSIGEKAFYGCTRLTSISIPNSVTSIGSSAFSGCSSLISLTIPFVGGSASATGASYMTLFGYIFGGFSYIGGTETKQYCSSSSYTTYYIPTTLREVTVTGGQLLYGAFSGCTGLTSVTIGNSVTSIERYAFYDCTGLTSITIPNSVTSIGEYAFYNCRGLTSITIGNSVTSIGGWAFYGCTGLTSITIPNSVTSIGDGAFSSCTSLTSITIPNSVTSIGEYAFHGCTGLTLVTIGNSVTSIGSFSFSGCSSLISLTIPFVGGSAGATSASSSTLFGYIFGTSAYTGGTETKQYYSSSSYTTYYIPTTLREVTVTGGQLLYGAFYGCSGLTSVTIGNSVTSIGDHAFEDCTGLTSVTIGNSVTSIGYGAFSYCTGLTSVTFANTSGWYCTKDSTATSGPSMDVTNASTNATNLVSSYYSYYWKRS